MANTKWALHMNYLSEKLSNMDRVVTQEELESQGIVALKDKRTGKTTPIRWLDKLPTVGQFELGVIIPIKQKEPQGLVATD